MCKVLYRIRVAANLRCNYNKHRLKNGIPLLTKEKDNFSTNLPISFQSYILEPAKRSFVPTQMIREYTKKEKTYQEGYSNKKVNKTNLCFNMNIKLTKSY